MSHVSMLVVLGILAAVMALRILLPNKGTLALFLFTVACLGGFLVQQHRSDISQGWLAARSHAKSFVGRHLQSHPEHIWPPVVGQVYPDLQLIDQTGRRTALSEFRGKVILLEPVGVPCPACIAFAGGQERGAYRGVSPQRDLQSVHHYARRYGQVDLDRDDVVLVQVLFYGQSMSAPTPAEARDWAEHFGMDRRKNRVVLAAEPYLLSNETREMIPGFQLIDKAGVLRYDSAGHSPLHNLYTELLPSIRQLCRESVR
ncbi:MAG: peroxiredoxin family protein [Bythopirellula sp.]